LGRCGQITLFKNRKGVLISTFSAETVGFEAYSAHHLSRSSLDFVEISANAWRRNHIEPRSGRYSCGQLVGKRILFQRAFTGANFALKRSSAEYCWLVSQAERPTQSPDRLNAGHGAS
jgi:hypothetical protein